MERRTKHSRKTIKTVPKKPNSGIQLQKSQNERDVTPQLRLKEKIRSDPTTQIPNPNAYAWLAPNPPPKARIPKIGQVQPMERPVTPPATAVPTPKPVTVTTIPIFKTVEVEDQADTQNASDPRELPTEVLANANIGEGSETSNEQQIAAIVPSCKGILKKGRSAPASKNRKVTFDPNLKKGSDTSDPPFSEEPSPTPPPPSPVALIRKSTRIKTKSSKASSEPVNANQEKLEPQQHGNSEAVNASHSGTSLGAATVPEHSESDISIESETIAPQPEAESVQNEMELEPPSSLESDAFIPIAESIKIKQAIAMSLAATIASNTGTIQDPTPEKVIASDAGTIQDPTPEKAITSDAGIILDETPEKAIASGTGTIQDQTPEEAIVKLNSGLSTVKTPMTSSAQNKSPWRTSKRQRSKLNVRENEAMKSLETMFETTQRTTLPYRVHQLWDCIQHTTAGTASLDIEKLVSIAAAIHKIPRDELNTDLQSAIKDGLIISEVVKNKGVESEVYSLPDPNTVNKGDHDWYCFKCHLGGPVVQCEDCPRVFHMNCLEEDRKPQQDLFVCPPCHFIATKPSTEKVNIKQKQLNTLLTYICDRIHDWNCVLLEKLDAKAWAQATQRPVKEAWRLNHFVYLPMDMTVITEKTNAGKYTSLEEFQVDCETLVHAIGCFFGSDLLKGVGIGGAFLRDIIHDINEIKLCHDCFRRSNEKDHPWWFCLPCATEHSVVWAKQAGYPYWPAKVMKQDGNKYDVRYFGGSYERGIVDVKNIMPIETSLTTLKVRKTAAWNDAYDELQKFMAIAKDNSLVETLPSRGKSTPGKSGTRRSASKTEEVVAKKSRVSEPAKPVNVTPKARQAAKTPTPAVTPKTPKPAPMNTPQSNGMSTLKKNVASPKPAAHGAGEPANANTPAPAMVLTVEPILLEYSDELKSSFVRDCTRGANSANGAPGDVDGAPAENTVSSSNESQTAENPVTAVALPVREFGESVLTTISKYTDLITEKYNQDISAVKRKQWCFNCEREAIYHCCWNTAYCSTVCQQLHWTKEHKRLCRRFKRDRHGNLLQNQSSSDDF